MFHKLPTLKHLKHVSAVEEVRNQSQRDKREKGCITEKARVKDLQRQRVRKREVVTDTFSGSGTQKALPTRPPVEHEATRGV